MLQLRLALRSLLRTPLVTAVAVLSLALGIGANGAIFTIFERMILRPLPVEEPSRLVAFEDTGPISGSISNNSSGEHVFSYPMFRDLQEQQSPFEGIAAHRVFGANLAFEGDTLSGGATMVSGNYFDLLGLIPAHGRLLSENDDTTPGAHPLAVLSFRYWRDRFNSDPSVLNRQLTVNGHPLTIVGVAPRGFEGTTLGSEPKIYVPISMREQMSPGWEGFDNRRSYWVYLFGRLKDGQTLESAETAINVTYQALIQELDAPLQTNFSEQRMAQFMEKTIELVPGSKGQSNMQAEMGRPLLLLLGVTMFVLLIACANIANLLLTKAANRSGEIAVQLSIGASRHHVVGQLVAESLTLSVAGAVIGVAVAKATIAGVLSIVPSEASESELISIGPATWAFMAALALLTSLVGLVPAWHTTRTDLVSALKGVGGGQSSSSGVGRFRAVLATAQIALSMTLLISAGLFTRSLFNVSSVDLGFPTDSLSTFTISPELNGYSPVESANLFARVEEQIGALPGVTSVTAALVPLIAGDNWGNNVSVQGFADGPDVDSQSRFNAVGTDFFRTLGVPLISGREFELADVSEAPAVAIVNEAFARKFEMGASGNEVVGKRMAVGATDELDIEIVGYVKDTKYSAVKQEIPPVYYIPYRQQDGVGTMNFYVRSQNDADAVLPMLRQVVANLDNSLPIENLVTMNTQVRETIVLDRVLSTLSAAFAVLATVLAAIGLYGVLAYAVAQRTREIGLRMALGADGGRVRGLVLKQLSWMAIPGAVVGVLAALALGRAAASLLYEMRSHDLGVFAGSTVLLILVATLAGMIPASRASRISPMEALRDK